jgi:mRNA-degrading endonuclease RelE of RelBE toxin-antitoxin system
MSYEVKTTTLFEEDFIKIIPKQYRDDVKKRLKKLADNPYVGKPLGDKYFRELKLDKFRIYFIIFEKEVVVFVVAVSDKKTQKYTIALIRERYPDLRNLVKNINKQI